MDFIINVLHLRLHQETLSSQFSRGWHLLPVSLIHPLVPLISIILMWRINSFLIFISREVELEILVKLFCNYLGLFNILTGWVLFKCLLFHIIKRLLLYQTLGSLCVFFQLLHQPLKLLNLHIIFLKLLLRLLLLLGHDIDLL